MEPRAMTSTKRKPLADTQSRGNIDATLQPKQKDRGSTSSTGLPHHESRYRDGPLTVRSMTDSPPNNHLVPLNANKNTENSKRDSQISTTSTNASAKGRRRKTHIGPWQLGSDLGKGGCGKVRKVRHAVTGQEAACKIIKKNVADTARAESLIDLVEKSRKSGAGVLAQGTNVMPFGIEREVVIMKLLDHPNVAKLYDVWENRNELYLILEYVDGGELFDHIEQNEYLDEDEATWIFRQIVVALLYCSRLGIHHRDLKPENILLHDINQTMHVKLVDFGMAALQPPGKLLTTPCGSIHYAAPEVFDKSYDGSKVDVWSLGVILYVMLTGTTPFMYDADTMSNNVSIWQKLIKSGTFFLPKELSFQAQDLIKGMLCPEPKKRITLEGVWNHAFLHRFGRDWGEGLECRNIEQWIGPGITVENWLFKTKTDIDREILRNLSTLWHSEREEILVRRLLSTELNLEKYFYAALVKHREEQLENYVSRAEGVGYSTSDYHHAGSHIRAVDLPPVPSNTFVRSKSQYSILEEAHLQARTRSVGPEPPRSASSYDPFRASSTSIAVRPQSDLNKAFQNASLPRSRSQSACRNQKQSGISRVEFLRKSRRSSIGSSIRSSPGGSLSARSTPMRGREASRISFVNVSPPPSALPPVKARLHHKRGVSFTNLHRMSTPAPPIASSVYELNGSHEWTQQAHQASRKSNPNISPHEAKKIDVNVVRSRKEGPQSQDMAIFRAQKRFRISQTIDEEARKVSGELEKYCEEAFKWSSDGSSKRTSASTSQGQHYTPNSSFSKQGSGSLADLASGSDKASQELTSSAKAHPPETPNIYITREQLAETRKRLAARYTQDRSAQSSSYQEVIAHLDALLEPSGKSVGNVNRRRITSAPEGRTPTTSMYLPPISEDAVVELSSKPPFHQSERASSNNLQESHSFRQPQAQQHTIRFIHPSSPIEASVAPLMIRKTSGNSRLASLSNIRKDMTSPIASTAVSIDSGRKESWATIDATSEKSIKTSEIEKTKPETSSKAKRWFSKKLHGIQKDLKDSNTENGDNNQVVEDQAIPDRGRSISRQQHDVIEATATARPAEVKKKVYGPVLFKFMNKRTDTSKPSAKMTVAAIEDDTLSVNNAGGIAKPLVRKQEKNSSRTEHDPNYLGVQRNWFARVLNIKPVSKVLCFQRGRGIVRQELMRLLRSWSIYGMKDVVYDRARRLIFANLGSVNHLGIKEVSFVFELFIVLDNGRRSQLCLARVTQQKGAASSFRRVMDEMTRFLTGRDVLVTDVAKRAEMEELLASA